MDKFLKDYSGLFLALVGYTVAGVVAQVRVWQRLSLLEVQMKDAQTEIKEQHRLMSELKDSFMRMKADAGIIEERMRNIAAVADNIKQTLDRSTEMRLRHE